MWLEELIHILQGSESNGRYREVPEASVIFNQLKPLLVREDLINLLPQ
jgi:hypothetical protein